MRFIAVCSDCDDPKRDPEQEHPGICECGGYIHDVPALMPVWVFFMFQEQRIARCSWRRGCGRFRGYGWGGQL